MQKVDHCTLKKILKYSYFLPALAVFLVASSYGDFFARVNIQKTFLLFLVTSFLFLVVPIFRHYRHEDSAPSCLSWRWVLFLSLPILATLPGIYLHGGTLNYLMNHELAIHIVYMVWLTCCLSCLCDGGDISKMFSVIGLVVIYVVLMGFGQNMDRPPSTFGNPNLFANFLITLLPIYLLMAMPINLQEGRWTLSKNELNMHSLYFVLIAIVGFIGLWQTQARAAVASLIMALIVLSLALVYSWLKVRFRLRAKVFVVVNIALCLFMLFSCYLVVGDLDSDLVDSSRFLQLCTSQAWTNRLLPYQIAIDSIKDSPLFGYGPGSSYNLFFEYLPADSRLYAVERSFKHVHNEVLEIGQEGGTVGLLAHFVVLGFLVWLTICQLISDKLNNRDKKLVLGAALGLAAYNFHGMFSLATRMTQNEMTMYLLVAVLLVYLPKAVLVHPVISFLQYFKPSGMGQTRGWLLGMIFLALAWYLEAPYLKGSYDLAELSQARVGSIPDVERVTDEYENSPSIYALKYLANLQLEAKNGPSLTRLLDKVEGKVANYQDTGYLRIMEYVLNHGKDIDLAKLEDLAENYQARDRYHSKTILWLARLAAFNNDEPGFIRQLTNTAQLLAVRNQLIHNDDAGKLIVQIGGLEKGAEIIYRPNQIEIVVSKLLLAEMMANARVLTPQNKIPELVYSYRKHLRQVTFPRESDSASQPPPDIFSRQFFRKIALWSSVPN